MKQETNMKVKQCKEYILYLVKREKSFDEIIALLDNSDFSKGDYRQAFEELSDEEISANRYAHNLNASGYIHIED